MKWNYESDIAYENIDIDKIKENRFLLKHLLLRHL